MVAVGLPLHTDLLVLETQEEWIAKLEGLVEEHGLNIVENWCDERDKHNHHLIHLAVHKNATQVIKVMVSELGFDPNIHRVSDKCTPLHLAVWFNHLEAARLLISYGADTNSENSYRELCGEEYEKLLKLDLGDLPSSASLCRFTNRVFAEQCWLQTHAETLEMLVQHTIQAAIMGDFSAQDVAQTA